MKDNIKSAFENIHADPALIDCTAAYLRREFEKRKKKRKPLAFPRLAGTFAAATAVIAGFFVYGLCFSASAYVSMDVNPSLELALNRLDRVVATYAFNEEGERILSEASLLGKGCEEAAEALLHSMEAEGYFGDGVFVSVTVQAASRDREQGLCAGLRRVIEGQVANALAAEVEVFPVSAEVRSNARGCHMSPAKYLAIRELLVVDEEATLEEYSSASIGQIRRRAQECRSAHGVQGENEEIGGMPSNGRRQGHHGQGHGGNH